MQIIRCNEAIAGPKSSEDEINGTELGLQVKQSTEEDWVLQPNWKIQKGGEIEMVKSVVKYIKVSWLLSTEYRTWYVDKCISWKHKTLALSLQVSALIHREGCLSRHNTPHTIIQSRCPEIWRDNIPNKWLMGLGGREIWRDFVQRQKETVRYFPSSMD